MTSQAIRQFSILLLSCLASAAIAKSAVQTNEEVSIRGLIDRYFVAYARKDFEEIGRLWSNKSPGLVDAKSKLREFFTTNDRIETRNINLRRITVEGDNSTAVVTLDLAAVEVKTKKLVVQEGLVRNLGFVRESGDWKIWSDSSPEEELATRLSTAKSDEDRKALLEAQPGLINIALRKALVEQGNALRLKGNLKPALTSLELAQRIAEQISDQAGIAQTWNEIAFVNLIQGNPALALEQYQKAQALCESLGDQGCSAAALTGIGNAYRFKGQTDIGIEFMRKGLAASELASDKLRMAAALNSLGIAYDSQNKYTDAIDNYRKSLAIYESLGETTRVAVLLSNIGATYNSIGDLETAIEYLQKSISLNESLGNKGAMGNGLGNIAVSHSLRGDFSSAMSASQKALAIFEALNDQQKVFSVLLNMANVHFEQGNLDLALEYQQKCLAMKESSKDQGDMAAILNNMGLVYTNQGDHPRALDYYKRSLSLAEGLKDKTRIARVLTNLGASYRRQGDYGLALEHYQKALGLREELGEKSLVAKLTGNIGAVYELQGDHTRALEYSVRAITLARETGVRRELSDALTAAGLAYLALGQTVKASENFREAISTIEALRADAGGGEQEQQQLFEKQVSPYYRMVELLAAQGESGEALSYAERAKARVLLDVLRSGKVNITKAMTTAEKAREQDITAHLVSLNTRLSRENRRPQPDQTRLAQLKTDLDQARLDQKDFQNRLYAIHPELRIRRGEAQPLTLDDTGKLLGDSKTALLEYVVTDQKTLLFVLTAEAATQNGLQQPVLKLYDVPLKRDDLVERVHRLNQQIANNDLEYAGLSTELFNLLVAPARQQLQGKTRMIIVPDDALWEIPFQALRSTDGRFLIQTAAVSYAPSLTVLREIVRSHKPTSGTSLLAMGNPSISGQTVSHTKTVLMGASFEPLPEAERMVKELGQMYGAKASKVYVGAEAKEEVLKAESQNYRILQLATHGVINNASPMYSYVALAQGENSREDGLLEAWEIARMDLQADLAVLSACETARGRIGAGEGVIGLAWALFVAGCPTTVVSQWKVESSSTTELMLAFHRNLRSGATKSEAMRQASLTLMGNKKYNHPFYWAGFIVVGDPQ